MKGYIWFYLTLKSFELGDTFVFGVTLKVLKVHVTVNTRFLLVLRWNSDLHLYV